MSLHHCLSQLGYFHLVNCLIKVVVYIQAHLPGNRLSTHYGQRQRDVCRNQTYRSSRGGRSHFCGLNKQERTREIDFRAVTWYFRTGTNVSMPVVIWEGISVARFGAGC